MCSDDYDTYLHLQHTHRNYFELKFKRDVEPGTIRVFDLNISQAGNELNISKSNLNEVRMICLRDDEFILDHATYEERIETDEADLIRIK